MPGRKISAIATCVFVFLSVILALGSGSSFAGPTRSDNALGVGPDMSEAVPGELNVKFKASVGNDATAGVLAADRLSVKKDVPDLRLKTVKVPKSSSFQAMIKKLESNPAVEYAEPNYVDHACMVTNDPLYPNQWHMHDFASGGVDAQAAWDIEEGDPSVIVAVVDSGVAYEDYGSFLQAPDLAETNFVTPYDFYAEDSHSDDEFGHGTHVTGTIAQSTNNNLGTAGVAHGCSIMPVRCLGPDGNGSHAQMAAAFTYASDHGAKVINYSAGGSDSQTKRDACQYAYEHGVTICAASGNDSSNLINYPAAYDQYCIAVGATNPDKGLAYYSNYGPQQDVVGPGGDTSVNQADGVLQQTFHSGSPTNFDYEYWMGTSMATPHVSGTAALFISKTGISDPDKVREQLQRTAHDLGAAGRDDYFGYGLVDAHAALTVPFIDHLDPETGMSSDPVAIHGANFGSAQGSPTVSFNGTETTPFTSWSDGEIDVTVPAGFTTGPVTVTTSAGISNGVTFTNSEVGNPAPTLTSIYPASAIAGGGGFTITLDGENFISDSVVRWGGFDRATTFVSAAQLTAAISASDVSSVGTVDVTVFNPGPGGDLSEAQSFTINTPPQVTSLTPTSGHYGDLIVIKGHYLGSQSNSYVTFSDHKGQSYSYYSSTTIKVKVPSNAHGKSYLRVVTPGGTSNSTSFYTKPRITGISSTSGKVGKTLTIAGSCFGASRGTSYVRFGNKKATSYSSWSKNKILVKVPSGLSGTVRLTVTTSGGSSNYKNFTVKR